VDRGEGQGIMTDCECRDSDGEGEEFFVGFVKKILSEEKEDKRE
jgi:hypothetical protein